LATRVPRVDFPEMPVSTKEGRSCHDAKHIGAGGDACHGPAPSATFKLNTDLRAALEEAGVIFTAEPS
jgi:hypothetical protein